jgi:hypothetical protein
MDARGLNDPHPIEALRRQARRLRIDANRAAAPIAAQFIALAELYEMRAARLEEATV